MRTWSVTQLTEDDAPDLDGRVVDDLESLRQRIEQRLHFPQGSWQLNPELGTPRLLGRHTERVAASVITNTILEEGGTEVVAVERVTVRLNHDTRELRYSAQVRTIYGRFVQRDVFI